MCEYTYTCETKKALMKHLDIKDAVGLKAGVVEVEVVAIASASPERGAITRMVKELGDCVVEFGPTVACVQHRIRQPNLLLHELFHLFRIRIFKPNIL